MRVELMKYPTYEDWWLAKECTLVTVGKNVVNPPDIKWKKKILESRHSPIRELRFAFKLTDIPYWVSVHLCRHVHAQPYVGSQRNDRQDKYDRNEAPQSSPVTMIWTMNAEELMTISNKRLCMKASKETREVVQEMCRLVCEKLPEFSGLLIPACEWQGGVCHEMFPCGRNK